MISDPISAADVRAVREAIDRLTDAMPKVPQRHSIAGPVFFFVALPLALLTYASSPWRSVENYNVAAAQCMQYVSPSLREIPRTSIVQELVRLEATRGQLSTMLESPQIDSEDLRKIQEASRIGPVRFGLSLGVDLGFCQW